MTSMANFPKSNNTQTQAMHKICTMCELNSSDSKWKIFDVAAAADSFFFILSDVRVNLV